MSVKPRKFDREVTGNVAGHANAAGIAFSSAVLITATARQWFAGVPKMAQEVQNSMRFSLTEDVAKAVEKMDRTPTETMLQAYKYAKLPFPKTWIEYSFGDTQMGWFLEDDDRGISVTPVVSSKQLNKRPMVPKEVTKFLITEDGFELYSNVGGNEQLDRACESECRNAMSMLLLLNSRSNVLEIVEPEEDLSKINKQRRILRKPEQVALKTIQFDVARVLQRRLGATPEEASEIMSASLVRGHFKVRRTGVFFWGPHVRGAASEEEKAEVLQTGLARDREVIKTGTSVLPEPDF